MRIKRALPFAISALCAAVMLTGCGDKDKQSDAVSSSKSNGRIVCSYSNLCQNGELFTDSRERLNFCDFETMQSAVLCPNPNCTHDSAETCSAFGMNICPILFEGSLYFFDFEVVGEDSDVRYQSKIYKADPDGTNRSVVATADDLLISEGTRMLIYDNIAYFSADRAEFDEYGTTTGYAETSLYSFDLTTEKLTKLTDICKGYGSGAAIYGVFGGSIYLYYSCSEEKFDYTDINTVEEALKPQYVCYDIAGRSIKDASLPTPVLIQGGCYIYLKDASTVVLHEDKTETMIEGFSHDAVTLVDGKLFYTSGGKCADIADGKVYSIKETEWDVVDFVGGKYILKSKLESGTYMAVEQDELIGEEMK